jgi:TRAP-type C4-dicarboxylate transport system substrate-binding protein
MNRLMTAAAAAALAAGATVAGAETLRVSHQWSEGDVRHKAA